MGTGTVRAELFNGTTARLIGDEGMRALKYGDQAMGSLLDQEIRFAVDASGTMTPQSAAAQELLTQHEHLAGRLTALGGTLNAKLGANLTALTFTRDSAGQAAAFLRTRLETGMGFEGVQLQDVAKVRERAGDLVDVFHSSYEGKLMAEAAPGRHELIFGPDASGALLGVPTTPSMSMFGEPMTLDTATYTAAHEVGHARHIESVPSLVTEKGERLRLEEGRADLWARLSNAKAVVDEAVGNVQPRSEQVEANLGRLVDRGRLNYALMAAGFHDIDAAGVKETLEILDQPVPDLVTALAKRMAERHGIADSALPDIERNIYFMFESEGWIMANPSARNYEFLKESLKQLAEWHPRAVQAAPA